MSGKKIKTVNGPFVEIPIEDLEKIHKLIGSILNSYYDNDEPLDAKRKAKKKKTKTNKKDVMNQISKAIKIFTVNKGSSATLFIDGLMEREILGRVEDVITDIADVGEIDRNDTLVNLGVSSSDLDDFICGLQDKLDIYVSEKTFSIIEKESHNLNVGDIVEILYNIRNY